MKFIELFPCHCRCIELIFIVQLKDHLKEYPRAEGVSAGFKVDLESASDLSRGIGVSETAEYREKVQRTSTRPHIDLVPGTRREWDWHAPDPC
jgi:hypothetical protein